MVLRIFKMIATSSFLTALECTKFVFGRVPRPNWGSLQRSPGPLAGLRGTNSKGGGEKEKGKGEGKGRRKEGETPAPFRKFLDPPLVYTFIFSQTRFC